MKFVWLTDTRGVSGPINPDRVCRLQEGREDGVVHVIFGAMPGGFDQIDVRGTLRSVASQLEGEPSPAPAAPKRPRSGDRRS